MQTDLIRSFLLVPGDDEAKLAAAAASAADALILDGDTLIDPDNQTRALGLMGEFLSGPRRKPVWIRLAANARVHDLAVKAPAGFVLSGVDEHDALYGPDAMVGIAEKAAGLTEDSIKFMALTAGDGEAVLNLDTYHFPALPRLAAISWDADGLGLALNAMARAAGEFTPLFQTVRSFTLLAAKSARVAAVETAFDDLHDAAGLARAAKAAHRDGFTGMVALHPDQLAAIHTAFTPSPEELAEAKALLAEFTANFGAFFKDGRNYTDAHRKAAQRVAALAKAFL